MSSRRGISMQSIRHEPYARGCLCAITMHSIKQLPVRGRRRAGRRRAGALPWEGGRRRLGGSRLANETPARFSAIPSAIKKYIFKQAGKRSTYLMSN